jgi:hypothetical protein
MGLDEKERNSIKEKILLIYKALGEFSKARTLEGKT